VLDWNLVEGWKENHQCIHWSGTDNPCKTH
jgi:hypothetical protein